MLCERQVQYQGRGDLGAQTTCEHVAPVTALKDWEKITPCQCVNSLLTIFDLINKNRKSLSGRIFNAFFNTKPLNADISYNKQSQIICWVGDYFDGEAEWGP